MYLRMCVFIHYEDLYSASSRLLLRSAPDPCTAKKKSFGARVKCVRKNPGEQLLRQRKPRGGDLGGTGGTVPQNLRWGDGPCIGPPNILRSSVVGWARK